MTMTDQQSPTAYLRPESDLLTSEWECSSAPEVAGIPTVPPRDDARERALAALRHEAVRADAERRLLNAKGTGALGGMMSPR